MRENSRLPNQSCSIWVVNTILYNFLPKEGISMYIVYSPQGHGLCGLDSQENSEFGYIRCKAQYLWVFFFLKALSFTRCGPNLHTNQLAGLKLLWVLLYKELLIYWVEYVQFVQLTLNYMRIAARRDINRPMFNVQSLTPVPLHDADYCEKYVRVLYILRSRLVYSQRDSLIVCMNLPSSLKL